MDENQITTSDTNINNANTPDIQFPLKKFKIKPIWIYIFIFCLTFSVFLIIYSININNTFTPANTTPIQPKLVFNPSTNNNIGTTKPEITLPQTENIEPTKPIEPITPVVNAPVAPSNNQIPEVKLLTFGWDYYFDREGMIPVGVRANDSDGGIAKVELYLDDEKIAEVYPYNMFGKEADYTDDSEEKIDRTREIGDWLEEKDNLDYLGYKYRGSFDWTGLDNSCGVNEGFLHIFVSKYKFYDVRTDKNTNENIICREGELMNFDDLYYFMIDVPERKTQIVARAYDIYGAINDSVEEF